MQNSLLASHYVLGFHLTENEELSEVKDDISEVKRNEFKELAKTYSLDNIDVWANAVKAEAFKSAKEGSKKTFQRMDMWDAHETKNNSSSLWNCVKE